MKLSSLFSVFVSLVIFRLLFERQKFIAEFILVEKNLFIIFDIDDLNSFSVLTSSW